MAGEVGVRLTGLRSFQRALRKADRTLALGVSRGFREIAKRVTQDAKGIARQKGLVKSGDLVRGIKPFVRQGSVGVKSAAEHGGYPYPRRLEYEGRGGSRYGPLASLNPAVERNEPTLEREAEKVLDTLANDWRGL